MKQSNRTTLYAILVVLMLPAFYMIFNTGNPNSLIRPLVPNPEYDFIVTLILTGGIAAVALILTSQGGSKFDAMLKMNRGQIKKLKQQGRDNDFIAKDFLYNLGYREKKGFVYRMAYRKIIRYIEEMDREGA
ncbi:MAG: hypothetical protein K9L68_14035 [Spirochaetales bacterium]|nr:hypothetical protein [Spirochaetales bacterium]MCF7939713.1 hypothetical protein [Spirochaetales bacterium]